MNIPPKVTQFLPMSFLQRHQILAKKCYQSSKNPKKTRNQNEIDDYAFSEPVNPTSKSNYPSLTFKEEIIKW